MPSKRILFTIDSNLFAKAKKKSQKMCCKSVQDYITYLIQRDLFVKRNGGRSQGIDSVKIITSHKPVFSKRGKPLKI